MNDIEERLHIFRVLSAKPEWADTLREALALHRQGEAEVASGQRGIWLGFEWHECHTSPVTLNKMVTSRLLDIAYSSNRSTYYKLRHPELVKEALEHLVEPEVKAEAEVPGDLFSTIVGHDNIKTILRYAIESERPAHILLQGVPASAKTLFLLELARLPNSYYCLAQTMTGPGLADVLFVRAPEFLCIDEIDRLSPENVGVLNSLMATGIISECKVGRTRAMELSTKVFAAGIKVQRLPADLLSRFIPLRFDPYTEPQFVEVCKRVLSREECLEETATFIASEVWRMYQQNADVRRAVQIARLCGGQPERAREVIRTLKQVGL